MVRWEIQTAIRQWRPVPSAHRLVIYTIPPQLLCVGKPLCDTGPENGCYLTLSAMGLRPAWLESPPSTAISAPEMNFDSSLIKNTIALATSSG